MRISEQRKKLLPSHYTGVLALIALVEIPLLPVPMERVLGARRITHLSRFASHPG